MFLSGVIATILGVPNVFDSPDLALIISSVVARVLEVLLVLVLLTDPVVDRLQHRRASKAMSEYMSDRNVDDGDPIYNQSNGSRDRRYNEPHSCGYSPSNSDYFDRQRRYDYVGAMSISKSRSQAISFPIHQMLVYPPGDNL